MTDADAILFSFGFTAIIISIVWFCIYLFETLKHAIKLIDSSPINTVSNRASANTERKKIVLKF